MFYDEDDSYGADAIESDVLPVHVPEGSLFFFRPDRIDDVSIRPAQPSTQPDYIGRPGTLIGRLTALVLRDRESQAAVTPATRPATTPIFGDDPCELGDALGLDLVTPRLA